MKNAKRFQEACAQVRMVQGFLDGLKEEREEFRTRLATVRDVDELRTLQGKAQWLNHLIESIEGA